MKKIKKNVNHCISILVFYRFRILNNILKSRAADVRLNPPPQLEPFE